MFPMSAARVESPLRRGPIPRLLSLSLRICICAVNLDFETFVRAQFKGTQILRCRHNIEVAYATLSGRGVGFRQILDFSIGYFYFQRMERRELSNSLAF